MSTEAMKRVVEAFDALPPDHPARYANLQINLLRTAIQQAEAKTDEPVARSALTPMSAGQISRMFQDKRREGARVMSADLLRLQWYREGVRDLEETLMAAQWHYTHPAPGVPAGQTPSVWNSIQIASWIGSQLMREPSMFERNAVCKFVRSLGRHPTLLKHSPKDTHPAPGVPDDVVRDAISTVREQYRGTDWGKAAECICDAIDAALGNAMLAAKEKP